LTSQTVAHTVSDNKTVFRLTESGGYVYQSSREMPASRTSENAAASRRHSRIEGRL
jgi:hypothetical protein